MLNVAVVRFPGSNCDFDTLRAAEARRAPAPISSGTATPTCRAPTS